jgi:hypothetical protein
LHLAPSALRISVSFFLSTLSLKHQGNTPLKGFFATFS